jgi:hypothetical protein
VIVYARPPDPVYIQAIGPILEAFMRCVVAALAACCFLAPLATPVPLTGGAAAAETQATAMDDAAVVQACHRLATDPLAGLGPQEWSRPFQTIDPFQAIPVCKEALRRHPDDQRLMLETAMAYLAGRKNDLAKPLLEPLVTQNNSSAMLALAYISTGPEATALMHKAAEAGNPSGLMLYAMAQMFGNGMPKDEIDGVRTMRRAAEAGSTRAMIVLANLYYTGDLGVGYDPAEAKRLLTEAAGRGDPSAKEALATLERNAKGQIVPGEPAVQLFSSCDRGIWPRGDGRETIALGRFEFAAIRPGAAPRLDLANPNPYMALNCPWP